MRFRYLLGLTACLAVGCSSEDEDTTTADAAVTPDAAAPAADGDTPEVDAAPDVGVDLPPGCDRLATPGEDDQTTLQTAFIEVGAGETLCLGAGTWHLGAEASLAVDGVTVRGAGRDQTILDFTDQSVGANGLLITSDGVTLEQLTVQNTPGDGIRANDVEGITFRDLAVVWTEAGSSENGAYGLYPVQSHAVRIENCFVQGARDAGIYVGQSSDIVVHGSEAVGNVAGIEIENSTDAEVFENHAHDNTAGILVFNLPELPVQDGKRAKVHHNLVENNNAANFGAPGAIVSKVPSGTGMFILASDANEVHDNTFRGNHGAAMILISYLDLVFGGYDDPDFNAFPSGNWIHGNTFEGNGSDPQGVVSMLPAERPFPSLAWDGCLDPAVDAADEAARNCWSDNQGEVSFLNFDYCNGFAGRNADLDAVTCTHDPLPSR